MVPSITIASPIRNREKIIPYYLENIYNINYPKNSIHLFFVVNNSEDRSEEILLNFKEAHASEYGEITICNYNKNQHVPIYDRKSTTIVKIDRRGNKTYTLDKKINTIYSHLAEVRNYILNRIKTDYLLSIDSDIMVDKDIINKLLETKKQIVSGLIYNGYNQYPLDPYNASNIMKIKDEEDGMSKVINAIKNIDNYEHITNWYVKNASKLTEKKVIPVDLTGAICLMSREVCKNTKYSSHPQGEDAAWSMDCQQKGYELYCRLDAFSEHLMNEDMLEKYIERNGLK